MWPHTAEAGPRWCRRRNRARRSLRSHRHHRRGLRDPPHPRGQWDRRGRRPPSHRAVLRARLRRWLRWAPQARCHRRCLAHPVGRLHLQVPVPRAHLAGHGRRRHREAPAHRRSPAHPLIPGGRVVLPHPPDRPHPPAPRGRVADRAQPQPMPPPRTRRDMTPPRPEVPATRRCCSTLSAERAPREDPSRQRRTGLLPCRGGDRARLHHEPVGERPRERNTAR